MPHCTKCNQDYEGDTCPRCRPSKRKGDPLGPPQTKKRRTVQPGSEQDQNGRRASPEDKERAKQDVKERIARVQREKKDIVLLEDLKRQPRRDTEIFRVTPGEQNLNTVGEQPPVRLGIVTWNVNHFGESILNDDQIVELYWYATAVHVAACEAERPSLKLIRGLRRFHALHAMLGFSPDLGKPRPHQVMVCDDLCTETYKKCVRPINLELKKRATARWIARLFKQNEWLDVLVLQEVNQYNPLAECLLAALVEEGLQGAIGIAPGPEMCSVSTKKNKRLGQREFYPIVYRVSRVTPVGFQVITSDGVHIRHTELRGPYEWNKHGAPPSFRPVVVHEIDLRRDDDGSERVNIGVVHTSPMGGREFERVGEYAQVAQALRSMDLGAELFDEWWVLAGDFYLLRESIVVPKDERGDLKDAIAVERNEISQSFKTNKGQYPPLLDWRTVKTQEIDYVRNTQHLTFEHQRPQGLEIVAPVSGSNWHNPKLLWGGVSESGLQPREFFATARIADFLLYDQLHWRNAWVGFLHPHGRGIVLVDTEDSLRCSTHWSYLSDHFPVGGILLSRGAHRTGEDIVVTSRKAREAAERLNRYRLARRYHRLVREQHTSLLRWWQLNSNAFFGRHHEVSGDKWKAWLDEIAHVVDVDIELENEIAKQRKQGLTPEPCEKKRQIREDVPDTWWAALEDLLSGAQFRLDDQYISVAGDLTPLDFQWDDDMDDTMDQGE